MVVLTELRLGGLHMGWGSRHHQGLIHHPNGASARVLQGGGHLQVLDLRIVKDLFHVVNGAAGHPRGIEHAHPMLGVVLGEGLVQLLIDEAAVFEASRVLLVVGFIAQIKSPNALAQGAKLLSTRGADVEVSVRRAVKSRACQPLVIGSTDLTAR